MRYANQDDRAPRVKRCSGAFAAFCLILILLPLAAMPQVRFYAQLSESSVFANRSFQVQYIIEGANRISEFKYPDFGDLSVREEFEIPINAANRSLKSSYEKIAVLSAGKAGRYRIPAATAVIDGRLVKSNLLMVTVQQSPGNSSLQYPEQVQDESEILPGQNIEDKISRNFFLQAEVNKKSCYVGEPLMAVYKACSRLNANSQVVKRPSLTGFSVIEMVDGYNARPEVEMIEGRPFFVHLIRKVQLFPLQAGHYKLEEAEVESVIRFSRKRARSAEEELDRILGNSGGTMEMIQYRKTLRSNPLNITVKALPDSGQPADFSGAVGKFSIKTEMEEKELSEGNLFQISVIVSGTGNFPLITSPEVKWPAGIEAAISGVEDNTNPYIYPLSGSKTFHYTVSVKDKGKYLIPAVEFHYFDPSAERYISTLSNSLSLNVSKGRPNILNPVLPDQGFGLLRKFPRQYFYFSVIAIAVVCWLIYLIFFSDKKNKKTAFTKAVDSSIEPDPDPFINVDEALRSGNPPLFYNRLQNLLWDRAAKLAEVQSAAMNKQNLVFLLKEKRVSSETITDLIRILNEIELSLYTPDHSNSDLILMRDKGRQIFESLKPGN